MPSVMTASESACLNLVYPPRLDLGAPLTPEQLQQSLQATMACHQGGPVWLFAYGSLIWRPECSAVERVRGRVYGYHRGLYLWSHEHRGTPQLPGLVFGLDRGGSCSGFAYRLPEDNLDAALHALWKREMPVPSYRPHWLTCRLEDGSQVQALGFVLERHLPSYAATCQTAYSAKCWPMPADASALPVITSSRPSALCAAMPCRTAIWRHA